MATVSHSWHIEGFRELRERACVYGPEFQAGDYFFQLQLHPHSHWGGGRPDRPDALYLTLVAELGSVPPKLHGLKVRACFRSERLGLRRTIEVKDTAERWRGGFGPRDDDVNGSVAAHEEEELDLHVLVEILEEDTPRHTVLRWPLDEFEALRAGHSSVPCRAGFHAFHWRRFEVFGLAPSPIAFRAELHPCIDATGNFYVSFRMEKGGPEVDDLRLRFDLVLEEPGYTCRSELLTGGLREWSRPLGVASHPTACAVLRTFEGRLTLRLCVDVEDFALVPPRPPSVWSDFVGAHFRYLLLSAAGDDVAGRPEQMTPLEVPGSTYADACASNVAMLRGLLFQHGVPSESIREATYDGESEQLHPRELLEGFLRDAGTAAKLVVYFAGHATDEGAWCFRWRPHGQRYSSDVVVAPQELIAWKTAQQPINARVPLEVISECVSAGAWCTAAKHEHLQGRVFAACAPGSCAWTAGHGSAFTTWIVGKGPSPWELSRVHSGVMRQEPWECSQLGAAGPMKPPSFEHTALPRQKATASPALSLGSTAYASPLASRPTSAMAASARTSLTATAPPTARWAPSPQLAGGRAALGVSARAATGWSCLTPRSGQRRPATAAGMPARLLSLTG